MLRTMAGLLGRRIHYGWFVLAGAFIVLLLATGVRATPGVLILPLEQAFGWSRATISGSLSLSLLLFGLVGPFSAALMQRFGVRKVVMIALTVLAIGAGASLFMSESWHLLATWGLLIGLGTGAIALVMGAVIVNRWFVERRGLAMGVLTGSLASGQLIFLPLQAAQAESGGWQPVVWTCFFVALAAIPVMYFLVPERPADVGLTPYGAREPAREPASIGNPLLAPFAALGRGLRSRAFWLLSGSFFVCGLSTNGLIGTHMIAACFDQGIPEVTAAGLLAGMGIFNLIGTTASGWLTDRWDSRWLLFWYYALRGVSLIYLPYSGFTLYGLSIFAVFYGLDWIATVPPTNRLANDNFTAQDAPILFGWVFVAHQIGAAIAAWGAGYLRTSLGGYLEAFLIAGIACLIAALMCLAIRKGEPRTGGAPEVAVAGA